ncbi:hypothetical protein BABINDRAFT_24051, partial [Babjeviella inositovora NRRL Y-12698]
AEKKEEDAGKLKDLLALTKFIRLDWRLISLALVCLVTSTVVLLSFPKWFGKIVDSLKDLKPSDGEVLIMGEYTFLQFTGLCFGACGLFTVAVFGRVTILKLLGEKLISKLRSYIMKKLLTQDAEFFDKHKTGDIMSRLTTDAHMVSRSITSQIADGLKNSLFLVFATAMMFSTQTTLAACNFVLIPLTAYVSSIFGERLKRASKNLQKSSGSLSKVTEEQLNAIKTVQSFAAESSSLTKFNAETKGVFNAAKKETILNTLYIAVCNSAYFINYTVVFIGGTYFVHKGGMTIGELTGYFFYADFACSSILALTSFYGELMKGTGAASRLIELMRSDPVIKATSGDPVPSHIRGEIRFENVTFAYPTRPNNLIFENCSFTIPAGSNVCIVGPSGRGKSTITSLLLRFYDPNAGRILLDGVDISTYNVKSIRRALGFVQQEPALLPGTIYENLVLGYKPKDRPSLETIDTVAMKANCQFIHDFPDGYDTQLNAKGGSLSGGQKQRVAIARTLLKNPAILILDEATSALDAKSESLVNSEIARLISERGMTTISIAHRFSTIRKAKTIIVLGHDGRVDEMGDFATLYGNHNSALYKILHDHEAKKPVEE